MSFYTFGMIMWDSLCDLQVCNSGGFSGPVRDTLACPPYWDLGFCVLHIQKMLSCVFLVLYYCQFAVSNNCINKINVINRISTNPNPNHQKKLYLLSLALQNTKVFVCGQGAVCLTYWLFSSSECALCRFLTGCKLFEPCRFQNH